MIKLILLNSYNKIVLHRPCALHIRKVDEKSILNTYKSLILSQIKSVYTN